MKRLACLLLILSSILALSCAYASVSSTSSQPVEYAKAALASLSLDWEISKTYYIHYDGAASIGNDHITDEWLMNNGMSREGYLFAFGGKGNGKSAIAFTTMSGQVRWAKETYDETKPDYTAHLNDDVIISGTFLNATLYSKMNNTQHEWYELNEDMTSSRGTPLGEGEVKPIVIPQIFGSANLQKIVEDENLQTLFTACLAIDFLLQFAPHNSDRLQYDSVYVQFMPNLNVAFMYFYFNDDYYMLSYGNVLNETIKLQKSDRTPEAVMSDSSSLFYTYSPDKLELQVAMAAVLNHLTEEK